MFEPGDVVICINAKLTDTQLARGFKQSLIEGGEYVVRRLDPQNGERCVVCGGVGRIHPMLTVNDAVHAGYCPTRFRKKLPPVAAPLKIRETIDA